MSINPEKKPIVISQSVAILVDGNNIEISLHEKYKNNNIMLNFDTLIPRLLVNRALNRLTYFREGRSISSKLAERLHTNYHGSVTPCHKSADIPLTIKAMQLSSKVDTIIIMSGDADYVELVRHLKSEGVRVEIAAVQETSAAILLDEADYFHPLLDSDCFTLPPSIQKHGYATRSKPGMGGGRSGGGYPSRRPSVSDRPRPNIPSPQQRNGGEHPSKV